MSWGNQGREGVRRTVSRKEEVPILDKLSEKVSLSWGLQRLDLKEARDSSVHSWAAAFPAQGVGKAQTLRLGRGGPAESEEHLRAQRNGGE